MDSDALAVFGWVLIVAVPVIAATCFFFASRLANDAFDEDE